MNGTALVAAGERVHEQLNPEAKREEASIGGGFAKKRKIGRGGPGEFRCERSVG